MEAAILENTPGTRSKDSTLFREIFREFFLFRALRTASSERFREIREITASPNAAEIWGKYLASSKGKCWETGVLGGGNHIIG